MSSHQFCAMKSSLTFKFKNFNAVALNFAGMNEDLRREGQEVVQDYAERIRGEVENTAPRDSSFMAEHVHKEFFRKGLAFEVGWGEMEFLSKSPTKRFYPIHVEFGTINTPAQPSLMPAYDRYRPQVVAAIAAMMKNVVIKRGKRK